MNAKQMSLTAFSVLAVALPGCAAVKSILSSGEISTGSIMQAYQAEERAKKTTVELEERIDQELVAIAEFRQNGQFSTADYREEVVGRYLTQLEELAPDNIRHHSVPKKIEELKATFTKEIWERKALAIECQQYLDKAKQSRLEESWRYVGDSLEGFAKCLRRLEDVSGDQAVIAQQKRDVVAEFDGFAAYALKEIKSKRVGSQFSHAVGFEQNLTKKLEYYREIAPASTKPDELARKMETLRKTFRDPEEIKAEKAKDAFIAWRTNVTTLFDQEWERTAAAEAKAKPHYDAGMAALNEGKFATALKELTTARQVLYTSAYPSAVALDAAVTNGAIRRGLSYEISAAISRVHFEEGSLAALYPELEIIQQGRPWLSRDDELSVRLYDLLADSEGKLAPKATDMVKRYAGRYSDEAATLRATKEVAQAQVGAAYALLGTDLATISHRQAASNPAEQVGKVVYLEEPVTAVSGSEIRFDFRDEYEVPVKCWSTGRVESVNFWTGEVNYEEECKWKTVKEGYIIVARPPQGVKVKKGDLVSFYAKVGAKRGEFDILVEEAAFVRVAPGGTTKWYLGASLN